MSWWRKAWIWIRLFPIGKERSVSEEIRTVLDNGNLSRKDRRYLRSLHRKAKGLEMRAQRSGE